MEGGKGNSVREIVGSVSQYSKKEFKEICLPRRKGDVPRVVANIDFAKNTLGWEPKNSSLEHIVGSYYGDKEAIPGHS